MSNARISHSIRITLTKRVVGLMSEQLKIMVKKNIHIYLNMLAMKYVDFNNVSVSDSGYYNNRFKRKASEALHIKQYKPTLNTQLKELMLSKCLN